MFTAQTDVNLILFSPVVADNDERGTFTTNAVRKAMAIEVEAVSVRSQAVLLPSPFSPAVDLHG